MRSGVRSWNRLRRLLAREERGVVSVLSMMFLILFGSLSAAMAVVSMGNLRTATAHLHVMRAMGAAETGLAVAQARIEESAARFVAEKGEVDGGFGWRLWTGTFTGSDGDVDVLDPVSGHAEATNPLGLADALANYHAADVNIVEIDGVTAPIIGPAPAGTDTNIYRDSWWVTTPAVALSGYTYGSAATPAAFQITYAPLANGTDIRAIVTGFDFDHSRGGAPLTRVLVQDFRVVKRVNQAIVAPSRVMIGKNVLVEGDLGAAFTEVDNEYGHPLTLRSDFAGMDAVLDAKLADLYDNIELYDADGDNRLRVDHAIEGAGVPSNETDYDGDGEPDGAFVDVTQDGYVDEFDLFIRHFDADGDGRVVLSAALTDETPADGLSPEFVASDGSDMDEDLALLIDSSNPDRNDNGIYGFIDDDRDGVWDAGSELLMDYDDYTGTWADQVLGYRDGFIDRKDLYAKVRGRLVFRTTADAWVGAHGDYMEQLRGPIRPGAGQSAMQFNAPESMLPDVGPASFTNSETALKAAADGETFAMQVADQLGVSVNDLATYEETSLDPTVPRYYRVDPDEDGDGLPDNSEEAYFEKMPFNGPSFVDWYYRPVYENMVFRNVQIPVGTNALFENCTFVGVTYVRTFADNAHVHWSAFGKLQWDDALGRPNVVHPRQEYLGAEFPPMLPESATPPEQDLFIATNPIDKGDVPEDQIATITNYDELPDPLLIEGKRVVDTKLHSNNIRFHDCLVVGSLVSDTPGDYIHVRNKLQFTGATRFFQEHPDSPDDTLLNPDPGDMEEIVKSSMLLPNYSVDVGSFNSPPEQDVRLLGTVIAGVLDVRGNASIEGSLMLTYKPVLGEGPMRDHLGNPIGNPAGFNTTIGYFGPDDGDGESLDPATLPEVDGVKIVGWDLDGDGLADLGPDETPTQEELDNGATSVPFHGYGRIHLRFDPNMAMPDGIMLPLQADSLAYTYREGRP